MKKLIPLFALISIAGCAAPWQSARLTVGSALGSVQAVSDIIGPELGPDVTYGLDAAIDALAAGNDLIDMWQRTAEKPPGWVKWVMTAINSIKRCVILISAYTDIVPSWVMLGLTAATQVLGMLLL